ncbi:MAG: NAD(P)/FAD-dependent oxidoreductase [Trueperaceae bacterium]
MSGAPAVAPGSGARPAPAGGEAEPFDAVVIGAGAGGLTVAFGLARIGKRVALVEGGAIGGDCTNVGCIPSKTLLDLAGRLRASGLEPGGDAWTAAAADALAEVRRRRDALREHETAQLEREPGLTLLRGRARLTADGLVDVVTDGGSRRLRAPRVVLATGARPLRIDLPGLPPELVWTNHELFEAAAPPTHLAVLGGGPIGVEMATAFARLGSRVTLVEALPRLLSGSEPEASAVSETALRRLGVDVRVGVRAVGFEADGGRLLLAATEPGDGAGAARGTGDVDAGPVTGVARVLMALGRRPAVADLTDVPGGLEALGIRVGRQGIVTDAAHRTGRRGVYAIGDVGERAKFTHAANAQGRRLVRHLTLPWLPLVREGDYPAVTFGEPEVAQIGPPLAALRRTVHPASIVSHRVDLADLDRGLTSGLREGFVLLHARRLTGRLLSATVVGPHAGELVQLLTWAQRRRVSLWQLSRHVVAYPALAEGIKRAADAFVFATLPALPRELAAYLRTRWRRPPADAPTTVTGGAAR